jgi:hypothetical protein
MKRTAAAIRAQPETVMPAYFLKLLKPHRVPQPSDALTKSRTAYQDFFALWKDADADIQILKQAMAEYGELQ